MRRDPTTSPAEFVTKEPSALLGTIRPTTQMVAGYTTPSRTVITARKRTATPAWRKVSVMSADPGDL